MNKSKNRGLVIIPARGGSKGIKNKNIVDVCGKPLIAYTIEPAKRMKKGLVERIVVSTDSEKIAGISMKLGVDVPFLRPQKISGDKAKSIDLILHALDFFEENGEFYDFVVLLQPTSPMRSTVDIEGSIELFNNNNSDSLISVCLEERVDETELYKMKNNVGIPLSPNHNKGIRRQDLERMYVRNAAIYITSTDYLKKKRHIISEDPLLFEMPIERSIDVDTKKDLENFRRLISDK